MSTDPFDSYEGVIALGAMSCAEDEFWCIESPHEGLLSATASKRLDVPVLIFCRALKCEWDDATEEGFRLVKAKIPTSQPSSGIRP
jgi:hypothetical protein